MTNTGFEEAPIARSEFAAVVDLFGGQSILKHRISSSIDAHEMILHGLPSQALEKLVGQLSIIGRSDAFETALGMSERTFQRHKSDHSRTLSTEQGSRAWDFARILTKAMSVFGSQEEAERWMIRPAMGLNRWRPIDLLATAAGRELVEVFLGRLEYGVYT